MDWGWYWLRITRVEYENKMTKSKDKKKRSREKPQTMKKKKINTNKTAWKIKYENKNWQKRNNCRGGRKNYKILQMDKKTIKKTKGTASKNNKCCLLVSQAIVKGLNFRYCFSLLQYLWELRFRAVDGNRRCIDRHWNIRKAEDSL